MSFPCYPEHASMNLSPSPDLCELNQRSLGFSTISSSSAIIGEVLSVLPVSLLPYVHLLWEMSESVASSASASRGDN